MTVGGWIVFTILAIFIGAIGVYFFSEFDSTAAKAVTVIVAIILIVGMLFGLRWYYKNTASGQRALVDQRSEFDNGIERTITVYTADGEIIAQYTGKIDIKDSSGGCILFDFEGKRYIYYNCFIESIAEIES